MDDFGPSTWIADSRIPVYCGVASKVCEHAYGWVALVVLGIFGQLPFEPSITSLFLGPRSPMVTARKPASVFTALNSKLNRTPLPIPETLAFPIPTGLEKLSCVT